jgi:metal-responsive CopG/Arc/MetJ family transcriptional regulator
MKNVTLSIPDDLLKKSREYAAKHCKSLNQFIRDLLKTTVVSDYDNELKSTFEHMDKVKVKTNKKWTRDELH